MSKTIRSAASQMEIHSIVFRNRVVSKGVIIRASEGSSEKKVLSKKYEGEKW